MKNTVTVTMTELLSLYDILGKDVFEPFEGVPEGFPGGGIYARVDDIVIACPE